jgi:lipopolysaccharide export LptBFGC system permease protein LptF
MVMGSLRVKNGAVCRRLALDDRTSRRQMEAMNQLNPAAESAWKRFRILMRWMLLAAIASAAAALSWLRASYGPMPLHMMIATALGVVFTVLLGTGLMGLVFVSRASGHDDYAGETFEEER